VINLNKKNIIVGAGFSSFILRIFLKKKKFRTSIHYCNLKINGKKNDSILKKINRNIIGFGMPFVEQKVLGPISNDILVNIHKKLSFN